MFLMMKNVHRLGMFGIRTVRNTSKIFNLKRDSVMTWRQFSKEESYVLRMKRLQQVKEDNDKCLELLNQDNCQFIIFGGRTGTEPLLTTEIIKNNEKGPSSKLLYFNYKNLVTGHDVEPSLLDSQAVFLDFDGRTPRFAVELPENHYNSILKTSTSIKFCEPRLAIFVLPAEEANLVSHAISLLNWNRTFKYCPLCGSQLHRNVSGSQKHCLNCERIHYPQLSSVAIALLTNPEGDRCLLVRQPRFVIGMFTAVAGYIEAGETLEDAIKREIAEEVGLDVINQRYLISQHWPFPAATLMMACMATVNPDQQINLDEKEVEDARWFSASEIKDLFSNPQHNPFLARRNDQNIIFLPPKGAVAHDLLRHFLDNNKLK